METAIIIVVGCVLIFGAALLGKKFGNASNKGQITLYAQKNNIKTKEELVELMDNQKLPKYVKNLYCKWYDKYLSREETTS